MSSTISMGDIHDALAERKRQLLEAESTSSSTLSSSLSSSPSSSSCSTFSLAMSLSSYRFIVAPMVGASDLAFRLLTRKYGATLCYTPMFYSDRFVKDEVYRARVFHTLPADRPLVVQFAANDPKLLVAAAQLVQDQCDAVDINLGCPTREARSLHYGSALLESKDHELVMNMVREACAAVKVPIFCKIRLLDDLDATIKFAKELELNGCKMLTVHGRKRGGVTNRRKGAADLQAIRAVKSALAIPVVSNGNVRGWQDVMHNLSVTGCDGIMSAEEVLRNPALFYPSIAPEGISNGNGYEPASSVSEEDISEGSSGVPLIDPLALAIEYVEMAKEHGTAVTWVIRHVKYMAERLIIQFQVHDDILDAKSTDEILDALHKCRSRRDSGTYIFDRVLQMEQKTQFPELARNRGVREQADRLLYGPLELVDGTWELKQQARADRQRAASELKKRKRAEQSLDSENKTTEEGDSGVMDNANNDNVESNDRTGEEPPQKQVAKPLVNGESPMDEPI